MAASGSSRSSRRVELPEESRKALIDCFKSFDTNGDGHIDIDEFPEALSFVGVQVSEDDLSDLLALFDTAGRGKLEIKDLVDNYHVLVQHSANGSELINAFKKYDINRDGYINLAELKKVLIEDEEKWTQDEAAQLLQDLMKYDSNGDGKFNYVEFVTMYIGNSYPFKKPVMKETGISNEYKMKRKNQHGGQTGSHLTNQNA